MQTSESVTRQSFVAAGIDPSASLTAVSDDKKLTLYIEAAKLRDELDQKSKELQKLLATLEGDIIEYFKQNGQQRVTRGGRTVYLARELWPKVVDDDLMVGDLDDKAIASAQEQARSRLIEALANDPETKHLVKASYNHQTLRSYILQDLEEGDDGLPVIPEHLRGKLGVAEQFKAKLLRS